jgi:hypothetical protein
MNTHDDSELRSRLSRVRLSMSNGSSGSSPATEDLDWFLFQSFPECAVPAETFAELVPVYESALRSGAYFDHELLFVRLLELHELVGEGALHDTARAAVERVLAGGFEPAEAIAAMRFAMRAAPADDPFLDEILSRPELEAFRFRWTVDFVLDERGEREYLAVSYLRDDDPATAALMERFAVPPARREKLAAFFAEDACRERLERGWTGITRPEEREALAAALKQRLPGFAPPTA